MASELRASDFAKQSLSVKGPRRDAGALSSGQEFPRLMYHGTQASKTVSSAGEEAALGPEWSRAYIRQDYPRVKHHWNGNTVTVNNAEEDAGLGGGWANSSAAFDPYKGPQPARSGEHDPAKWVDEWPVPGLSFEHRQKIKAQLLRADGAFERSLDADSAVPTSMRQAFDGVARVLFEAGILTRDLLRKDIPQLVWDSAIAGGWWRSASETPQNIFPERLGHYWVWRDDSRDWKELFRAEAGEWEATLLEAPPRKVPASPASLSTGTTRPAPSEGSRHFISEKQRLEAVAVYTKSWQCSEAALARTARVDPADLSKWKKNLLPVESDKKTRIEKALGENEGPTPPIKRKRQY